jgi:hypothetical protein
MYIKSQFHWMCTLLVTEISVWHWSRLQWCLVREIIWPFWLPFGFYIYMYR